MVGSSSVNKFTLGWWLSLVAVAASLMVAVTFTTDVFGRLLFVVVFIVAFFAGNYLRLRGNELDPETGLKKSGEPVDIGLGRRALEEVVGGPCVKEQ
jgi:hypothetical protein